MGAPHNPNSSGSGEGMPKFHPSGKRREAPAEQRVNVAAQLGKQSDPADCQTVGLTSITVEIMGKADTRFH